MELPAKETGRSVWWIDGSAGIGSGLASYRELTGPIEADFDAIEARAKARSPHHLIAAELALIVEFKRWPGLRASVGRRVLAGPAPDELTSRALGQARDGNIGAAMDTLCQIREVGVPTASAILAAVYPDRFAVIDRYVMAEIGFVLTACAREGWPADESLALLAESLAEWVQHAAVAAYPLFVAGLIKKAELVSDRDHESFQTRDIEKAMYGHFLKRTGRKVL